MGTEIANTSQYSRLYAIDGAAGVVLSCVWLAAIGGPTAHEDVHARGRPAVGARAAIPSKAEKEAMMTGPMRWAVLISVGVGLWLSQVTLAQEPQLGEADRAFIKMAASSGQAEIQLGKLAAERADGVEVWDFATRLEKDHTQANLELLKILDAQRIDISRDMEPYQATAAYLSQLRGAEFDHAYVQHMVKAHEEAISQFTAEAKEGRNPELKAYAAKVLPTLQAHLQLARDLAAKHQWPRG